MQIDEPVEVILIQTTTLDLHSQEAERDGSVFGILLCNAGRGMMLLTYRVGVPASLGTPTQTQG